MTAVIHINRSSGASEPFLDDSPSPQQLRDLAQVADEHLLKHLSRKGREALLTRRPFQTMEQLQFLNRRDLEAVVLSGACDGVAPLSAQLYPFAHEAILAGSAPVTGVQVDASEQARLQIYSTLVRIRNELRFLEMHLVDHPLRVLRAEATRVGCSDTLQVRDKAGQRVRLVALVSATRRVLTRGGAPLQFVTLEDEFGLLEATLAAGLYTKLDNPIANPGPFLLEGTMVGPHRLHIRKVQPFHERPKP